MTHIASNHPFVESLVRKPYQKHGEIMSLFFCTSLLLISLFASSTVFAEAADKDKPIELEADSLTVNDATQTSTYLGNVILTQGTLVMHADKLVVLEDDSGFGTSTAIGNPATFKQKSEGKNEYMYGSAQRIEYDGRMDKVELYTKAWVKQGEDVMYGDYISYDGNAEYAEVKGGKKSESAGPSSGRVRVIIQPKDDKEEDAPPANVKTPVTINKLKLSDELNKQPSK